MTISESPQSIVEFWFSDKVQPLWFQSTPEYDTELRERFETVWQAAEQGMLDGLQTHHEVPVSLIVIL